MLYIILVMYSTHESPNQIKYNINTVFIASLYLHLTIFSSVADNELNMIATGKATERNVFFLLDQFLIW